MTVGGKRTVDQWRDLVRESPEVKHEYVDGTLHAMGGGSRGHMLLVANAAGALNAVTLSALRRAGNASGGTRARQDAGARAAHMIGQSHNLSYGSRGRKIVGRLVSGHRRADFGAYGGRKARQAFAYDAYVPDPIAELDLALSPDIVQGVMEAEQAVRRLSEHGQSANLETVARPLLRAESVASSRIEGFSLSQRRVAEALFDPEHTDITAQPVVNNIPAMEQAFAAAMRTAGEHAQPLAARLDLLRQGWWERAARPRRGSGAARLISLLPAYPVLNVATVAQALSSSEQVARPAMRSLAAAGILSQITVGTRNRAWAAKELFAVMNAFQWDIATPDDAAYNPRAPLDWRV